jgi:cbb3-type cytochrome oxidase subunit 3
MVYAVYSNAIFTVVCIGLNLACFFAYRKHKRQQQQRNTNASARDEMEWKFLIYTIVTFLSQLLMTIFVVSFHVYVPTFGDTEN